MADRTDSIAKKGLINDGYFYELQPEPIVEAIPEDPRKRGYREGNHTVPRGLFLAEQSL